jgi:hypothetical protein
MSVSATDPLNRLTRRVNRPENHLDSLRADNQTLKGCLGIDDVTQYDDYQSIAGGNVTNLDYTGSGDSVDSMIVTRNCPGTP